MLLIIKNSILIVICLKFSIPLELKDGKFHELKLIDLETNTIVDAKKVLFKKTDSILLDDTIEKGNSIITKEIIRDSGDANTQIHVTDGKHNNTGETNIINIAYILDDKYVIPTCVSMTSVIANKNESTTCNFYLITNELSDSSVELFKKFASDTVFINIINVELNDLKNIHKFSEKSYCVATESALLKFKIPSYLPNVQKVLYMDGDIIVRTDLSQLYNTDISNFYLAAIEDSGTLYSKNPIVLKFKKYFNSGVMLLNLDLLRKEQKEQTLIDTKKNSTDSSLMDQNIFNEVLGSKVTYLTLRYNCLFVNLIRASHKFNIKDLNHKYNENFSSLNELAKEAYIVHYSSKDKPWKYSTTPLSSEWYSYYLKMCLTLQIPKNSISREFSLLSKNDTVYMEPDRPRIIVSMTTFPARINLVHIPLSEILTQTIRADKVILWLAETQFPKRELDLPKSLLDLCNYGLTIKWVNEDIKAHKKYFYAIQEYPNDIVVTVDDDLHYSRFMLERLLDSYKKNPFAVSASRVHLMLGKKVANSYELKPYKEWKHEYEKWVNEPSMQLFPTCGAGTLFPPYSLRKETFDIEKIKNECLEADDVWLKLNMVMSGTSVVLADIRQKLRYVENSQDVALWKSNVIEGGNDVQISTIINNSGCKHYIINKIFEFSPYPNKNHK